MSEKLGLNAQRLAVTMVLFAEMNEPYACYGMNPLDELMLFRLTAGLKSRKKSTETTTCENKTESTKKKKKKRVAKQKKENVTMAPHPGTLTLSAPASLIVLPLVDEAPPQELKSVLDFFIDSNLRPSSQCGEICFAPPTAGSQ